MNIRIAGTIRALSALWLAFLCLPAVAATYYVDNVNGLDAQNGTSTTVPWQHCPGDPAAYGIALATTLSPGDVVLFNGGVTYSFAPGANGYINVTSSGTSGAPITFRSGHLANPQWGTTPAFINGANAGTAAGIINLAGTVGNIVIDGLAIGNQTNVNDYSGLVGCGGRSSGNITIQNCILTNGGGCGIYMRGLWGAGVNPANFCISNCFVEYFNWHGIFFDYGFDNIVITNCTVHYTGTQIYPGVQALGDNICLYYGSTDQIHNVAIDGNDLGTTPTKGCLLVEAMLTDLYLRGNNCHGTNAVAAWIFNGYITNILCYNNVYNLTINPYDGIYRFETDWGANEINGFRVYNDTVVANMANGAIFNFSAGNSTASTLLYNVDIRNCVLNCSPLNIPLFYIAMNSAGTGLVIDTNTFTCDYNVYNPTTPSVAFTVRGNNYTLAGWQALMGKDKNSSVNTPAFASFAGGNFHLLSSDTVAATHGTNIFQYLSCDKDGVQRPAANWTIGAYECRPVHPSGLIATPQP